MAVASRTRPRPHVGSQWLHEIAGEQWSRRQSCVAIDGGLALSVPQPLRVALSFRAFFPSKITTNSACYGVGRVGLLNGESA